MSMLISALTAVALTVTAPLARAADPVARTADVPAEFGTDWHDPITAAPPVPRPSGPSCQVTLAEARFRDFTPYEGSYTPPAACGDRWSKAVLRLDGKVQGRQYDRLGYLRVGGVEIFSTSTPEPSPDGIEWTVEKDVTRYTDILRRPQDVEMLIANVVDDTYTGVLDVKVTLTLYEAPVTVVGTASESGPLEGAASATGAGGAGLVSLDPDKEVPDQVRTLTADRTLTAPRNTVRVLAEVYATGSGGGCEEFWYLSVPPRAPYSCQADDGPYREVQIKVDGRLAGIATPFPHVWTGGWSNPFLWYVVPGPRAFDVKPIEYDLTPFAGLLDDGRPHRIEVGVVGVPAGQSGWSLPVNVLLWQDAKKQQVTGGLLTHKETTPVNSSTYTPGDERRVDTEAGHALTVGGYVDTSQGRVVTTVTRNLANTSVHRWTDGENTDGLDARWTDDETVTVNGRTAHVRRTYTMDGTITLGADDRLRTVLTLGDRAETSGARHGWSRTDDTYTGDASYTVGVPRDQRHAVATTSERYRISGAEGCYDRALTAVQGVLVQDSSGC